MCFFKFLPTENSVIKSYLGHFHNSLHGRALNNYFQSLKQNKRESRIKKFAYTSIQSMLKKKKGKRLHVQQQAPYLGYKSSVNAY